MDPYVPSLAFTSVFSFVLGLFVLSKNPKNPANLTWGAACLFVGAWSFLFVAMLLSGAQVWADRYARGMNVAAAYIPVLIAHFSRVTVGRRVNGVIYAGYALAFTFTIFGFTDLFCSARPILGFRYYAQWGPLFPFYTAQFVFYCMYSLYVLAKDFSHQSPDKKNQIKYILTGLGIGYLTGTMAFLPVYDIKVEPFLVHFVWLYAAIISYAILKHRLMDIRVIVQKTFFYSSLIFVLTVVYFFAVLTVHRFFIRDQFESQHSIASLAIILIVMLLLRPLEKIIRKILDKKFFKGTIEELSLQKEKLETELERRERLKSVGILAAGMAHEIKNPITAIRTFAEYLPKKGADPEFREKFGRLLSVETERISGIVRDLLQFARPGEPVIARCDAAKVIEDITDLLRGDLTRHSIELKLDHRRDAGACLADASQLKQALLNIILNAIDAMKPKGSGSLGISCQKNGDRLDIAVEDTGIGIAPDKMPHLFDPFYSGKEDGTGLGLAITHSIIEKNRGKISVESQAGKGTKFTISLPATA